MTSRIRVSSLNPYATSYVPLPRPGPYNESETSKIAAVDIESSVKNTAFTKSTPISQKETKQNQLPEPGKASRDFKIQFPGKANGMTKEQYLDEAHEMDLAYLSVMFPGMSEQSLADVYALTGEDLDSTVEMMREFEIPAEFSPRLLLQTPVYEPPAEVVGVRLKEAISGEASGSSSSIASEYATSPVYTSVRENM